MTVTVVHPTKDVPEEIYSAAQVLAAAAGMNIHGYTPLYIIMNKVEQSLGTYTEVLIVSITLTYSQNAIKYTYGNPHPSQAPRC
jgi:hypothetical protein